MVDSTADPHISIRQLSERAIATSRRLAGSVVDARSLSGEDRASMYQLFTRYFEASRDVFERDLAEKDWVILLRDVESDSIGGFSTLMRFDVDRCTVFFSGDTIVERAYWGTVQLPRLWGEHVFRCAEEMQPRDAYWFLISSGFRTYRYLPVFFTDFYPSPDRKTPPDVKRLLDEIAVAKFGGQYDARTGVVRLANRTPLRTGVSDVDQRILEDRNVRFFVDANPAHATGDELACIVRISRDNVTPAGLRMLQRS